VGAPAGPETVSRWDVERSMIDRSMINTPHNRPRG
jgi:hypothetical protein